MRIRFSFGSSDNALKLFDYGLAVLCFDSSNPLHRCMIQEFDFVNLPRPVRDSVSGDYLLFSDVDFSLFELFKMHPDTRMSNGVLKAEISPKKWLLFLENCFISYLSVQKTSRLSLPKGL